MATIITGALGFLGSDVMITMARKGHLIYAIDKRLPSKRMNNLISSFKNIHFIKCDIGKDKLPVISEGKEDIDFMIHFADKWSYDMKDMRTLKHENHKAIKDVIEISTNYKIKRIIYLSTITTLPCDEIITEKTTPLGLQKYQYGRSKLWSEHSLINMREKDKSSPSIAIVKATAIYDDVNCLPPLNWLINRWTDKSIKGRIIPGLGVTSTPYLHRDDLTTLIENILKKHENLKKEEIFLASPNQTATHTELFGTITKTNVLTYNGYWYHNVPNMRKPIYFPKWLIKIGFLGEVMLSRLGMGMVPKEQMWMFDYIDKQIITNSSQTQDILDWKPTRNIHNDLEYIVYKHKHNDEYKLLQENREAHSYSYIRE
jgi:nucleoside-diphosphate-sugar epimerase